MAILIAKQLTFSSEKKLAAIRLEEAKVLYRARQYSGAYYLSGYAIELGLKAYFCKSVRKYSFPEKEVVDKLYMYLLFKFLSFYQCSLGFIYVQS